MTDDNEVRETIYQHERYGGEILNMSLPDAIAWLSDLLEEVPTQHRERSRFYLEMEDGGYDESARLDFHIFYDRPMTQAEIEERDRRRAEYAERQKRQQEMRERAALAALKAKYEA